MSSGAMSFWPCSSIWRWMRAWMAAPICPASSGRFAALGFGHGAVVDPCHRPAASRNGQTSDQSTFAFGPIGPIMGKQHQRAEPARLCCSRLICATASSGVPITAMCQLHQRIDDIAAAGTIRQGCHVAQGSRPNLRRRTRPLPACSRVGAICIGATNRELLADQSFGHWLRPRPRRCSSWPKAHRKRRRTSRRMRACQCRCAAARDPVGEIVLAAIMSIGARYRASCGCARCRA